MESTRDACATLVDLHASLSAHRVNEIMRVLTVMSSIFIPLTFLAGVYGMNFQHIPELDWKWAYPAFWGISVFMALILVGMFWSWGWLRPPNR